MVVCKDAASPSVFSMAVIVLMSLGILIFMSAVSGLFYTYVLYPVLLRIIRDRRERGRPFSTLPTVSVIIPFHNEERWVIRKLDNALSWTYPEDRLQIIAVSDGSTDRTTMLLRQYDNRVTVVAYSARQGKPTALNLGAAQATGEILIFTDANVFSHPDAVRVLVQRYTDASVGGVCGNVALQGEGNLEPLGEGFYMQYERWLFAHESRGLTMVGADGALFSIRRALFAPLPIDTITDDFAMALSVVAQDRRVVYEPAAHSVEIVVPDVQAEFRRKIRMIAGGYQTLWRYRRLLNPLTRLSVAWQLLSHKLLRWLVPVFLLSAMAAAFVAQQHPAMALALWIQIVFYSVALCGWVSQTLRRWMPVYVPYYFCAVNAAAAIGLWRYLIGGQSVIWHKAKR
ncbi:MAG: glycosyltransferase family 2 protein [Nitrospirota bacterium]|nr:glycosyltransferase family 2 protein [Nitrospirota bacterium]